MSFSDCPHFHRSQIASFCEADSPRRLLCVICTISWVMGKNRRCCIDRLNPPLILLNRAYTAAELQQSALQVGAQLPLDEARNGASRGLAERQEGLELLKERSV